MSDVNPNMLPDAPLVALLDKNYLLGKSPDELREIVRRLRTITSQPVTLRAKVAKESGELEGKSPRRPKATGTDLLKSLGL
jgi:hypothetical protein